MSNCNCKMGLIWKPCPREPFECKRCYAKMRNSWRTWRLAIPTYPGGIFYADFDTLEQNEQSGEAERYLEFDVSGVIGGGLTFHPCIWTNYGQKVFDTRLIVTETYNGSDGAGGYYTSANWPDWIKEVVAESYELRFIARNYRIDDLRFVPAEYDSEDNLVDDEHFEIKLFHYLHYNVTDSDGSEGQVIVTGASGGIGALQVYRCYDVEKCPLPDGESMRFHRDLPTEPFEYSGAGTGDFGYFQERSPYVFPPYIDGYHVDIDPIV